MPEPQFVNTIKKAIQANLLEIHTCLPGQIEQYDHTKQKADVKPLIKKKYVDGSVVPMPVISNVPVVWPAGGGGSITFPLKQGDGVLLVFSERSLDTWLSKGGDAEPGSRHKFDLSDAIAIPGLHPFTHTSNSDNNTDFLLKYKTGKFRIDQNGKIAFGSGSNELVDLLEQVVDALIASTTATALGPQPLSKTIDTTFAQIKAKIALIKGSL